MTTTIPDTAQLFASLDVPDDALEHHIMASDPSMHKTYLGGDNVKDAVRFVASTVIEKYMNNPDVLVVPHRKKTKFLLVLNNIAMKKSMRNIIFEGLTHMDSVFEASMKEEGTLPFDSELGRMSEHALVLIMRVSGYKVKAAQVQEFAENHTQFAVQLLLAVLLKEPPYEFELRCNCISGLLGFSNPQAFFSAGSDIEFNDCEKFGYKIDFIASLLLRLQAVQVVNDVLSAQLLEQPSVPSLVHVGVTHMMRALMNIFQFMSADANGTQFRQHILLSTTFCDSVSILYLQAQVRTADSILTASGGRAAFPPEILPGIALALKFMSFCTFHMGRHARCLRPLCTFVNDLLNLRIRDVMAQNPQVADQFARVYSALFHFLSNIDALGGDEGVMESQDDYVQELTSAALHSSIRGFLEGNVAALGFQMIEQWHSKLYSTIDQSALVSQDTTTWGAIDQLIAGVKQGAPQQGAPAPPPQAQPSSANSLLGNLPGMSDHRTPPTQGNLWANAAKPAPASAPAKQEIPAEAVQMNHQFVVNHRQSQQAEHSKFACALNGNTMKVPVTSPYGHNFEKDTIEMWLNQQGPVCPITGRPLNPTDLQLNRALQNEIMQAMVQQTMAARSEEAEADMYDF